MKLSWGASPRDVDSHLFTPDGTHIFWSNKGSLSAAPYANLDVDDVTSYGPEVVTIRRLMVGTYVYALHNYSQTFNPGMTQSPTLVQLNIAGSTRVFTMPAGEVTTGPAPTDWVSLFRLAVDAQCNITVTQTGTWSTSAPTTAPTATPTYCTPTATTP